MRREEIHLQRTRELLREARREKRRKEVQRSIVYLVLFTVGIIAAFMLGVYIGENMVFICAMGC